MEKNTIIQANFRGTLQYFWLKYNEDGKQSYDFDFKSLDNNDIYFTEEEALQLAKTLESVKSVTDIEVLQPLTKYSYYKLDYSKDGVDYLLIELDPYIK